VWTRTGRENKLIVAVAIHRTTIDFINNYNMNIKLKTLKHLSPKEYLLKNYDIMLIREFLV